MKKGFTPLNLEIPKPVKAYYERQAKRLMVSVSAVVRSVLTDHAKQARNSKTTSEVSK